MTETAGPKLNFFVPHPNLSDEINRNICRSEIEGGVFLRDLEVGAVLEIETRNHFYLLENRGHGLVLLSGHPKFCPQPVLVKVNGSTWGKAMIKMQFIGRDMHLEFRHPTHGVIRTSRIQEIRQRPPEVYSEERLPEQARSATTRYHSKR
ncbi:MAG: hypothetical protein HY236_06130 [Acidobacteria bacterium]|nr:hypothetical protein [Acidobacteriota bacterium]